MKSYSILPIATFPFFFLGCFPFRPERKQPRISFCKRKRTMQRRTKISGKQSPMISYSFSLSTKNSTDHAPKNFPFLKAHSSESSEPMDGSRTLRCRSSLRSQSPKQKNQQTVIFKLRNRCLGVNASGSKQYLQQAPTPVSRPKPRQQLLSRSNF